MTTPVTEDVIVDLRDICFGFGNGDRLVLANVSLSVPRGSFLALVGPSGVGKSSLLRVIAGLVPLSHGQVKLYSGQDAGRRPAALVFQDPRLLPWRRVLRNVEFGLEGLSLTKAERLRRAEAALAIVGLAEYGDKWPYQLSGGQRQRVGIARALAVEPDLLLVDEPFGALDMITRQTLQDELLRIWRTTGASVIFVTHDLDEAVYLADRVILLGGRPARIMREIIVEVPRPRRRDATALVAHVDVLHSALGETFIDGGGI